MNDSAPQSHLITLSALASTSGGMVTLSTGKEALEAAISEKPDLILMDFLIPGMDGWEATRMLRSNPETKDIPILATTALSRPADLKSCINAGCNDYIVKPFPVDEL